VESAGHGGARLRTGAADVGRWRRDNGRYFKRIRARYPRLLNMIEQAADNIGASPGANQKARGCLDWQRPLKAKTRVRIP
jgi:hypothetical protein